MGAQTEAPAFQDTRLVNLHTNAMLPSSTLQLRIGHRFGTLNGGFYELWGLDQANMRIGFEYGLHSKMMVGVGRTSTNKTFDAFMKTSLLEQTDKVPVSILFLSTININGQKTLITNADVTFSHRMSFSNHLIIASKINDRLSVILQPIYLHQNLVETPEDKNDMLAFALGGKYSISRLLSFTGEYIYRVPTQNSPLYEDNYDSFSLGIAINTKGHYFSLHLTNSAALYESGYIAQNFDTWEDGGIRLGFNIIRNFQYKRHTPQLIVRLQPTEPLFILIPINKHLH